MGICDAPRSLLKWLAGELWGGLAMGAVSFDVPGSRGAGCTLPCTDLSVAQLHSSLGSPCLTSWLAF